MHLYTVRDECKTLLESQSSPELVEEIAKFTGIDGALKAALAPAPAVLFRHIATASRETERFLEIADELGCSPLLMTYSDDRFTPAQNPYKLRLGKPRVEHRSGHFTNVSLIPFTESVGARLRDIRCLDGKSLVQFHGDLAKMILPQFSVVDMNGFIAGEPRVYYERIFALFTCMGIFVESYVRESYEAPFIEQVVFPAFEATLERFGCRPVITRLLPDGSELDLYWESLPPAALEAALSASGQSPKFARLRR